MIAFFVGLGGALGAGARFALGGWLAGWAYGFPWATLAANGGGSLLLGWASWRLPATTAAPHARAFITIGVCGGFTTFSTFDLEMVLLIREGRALAGVLYAVASIVLCVAGIFIGRRLAGRAARMH